MHIGILSSPTCSAVNVMQNVFSTPNPVIDEAIVIGIMPRPQKSPTLPHISHETIFTTSFKTEFVVQMIYGIPLSIFEFKSTQVYRSLWNIACSQHIYLSDLLPLKKERGRRGRDRMIVGFTTAYAISAYDH